MKRLQLEKRNPWSIPAKNFCALRSADFQQKSVLVHFAPNTPNRLRHASVWRCRSTVGDSVGRTNSLSAT